MSNVKNFRRSNSGLWERLPVPEILDHASKIDVSTAADEILDWIIGNVENFIDNSQRVFRLDLVLDNDSDSDMPNVKSLQDLYRAIPDEEEAKTSDPWEPEPTREDITEIENEKSLQEAVECRQQLDSISQEIFDLMKAKDDKLQNLFNRMVFYYERIVHNPDNKKEALKIDEELKQLIRVKDDAPEILKADIQKKINAKIEEGVALIKYEDLEGSANIVRFEYEAFDVGVKISGGMGFETDTEYTIPEGFVCYIEIAYHNKLKPVAMF